MVSLIPEAALPPLPPLAGAGFGCPALAAGGTAALPAAAFIELPAGAGTAAPLVAGVAAGAGDSGEGSGAEPAPGICSPLPAVPGMSSGGVTTGERWSTLHARSTAHGRSGSELEDAGFRGAPAFPPLPLEEPRSGVFGTGSGRVMSEATTAAVARRSEGDHARRPGHQQALLTRATNSRSQRWAGSCSRRGCQYMRYSKVGSSIGGGQRRSG